MAVRPVLADVKDNPRKQNIKVEDKKMTSTNMDDVLNVQEEEISESTENEVQPLDDQDLEDAAGGMATHFPSTML